MNLFDEQDWNGRLAELAKPQSANKTLRVGDCTVNCRTGQVETPGQTRHLRRKELELLSYLHQCAAPVSRDQLLREVWNCSNMVTRTVDQTVATLRKKIESDPERPRFLKTVYGTGYRLVV
jgi:DNA-binding response OmpR family regulator